MATNISGDSTLGVGGIPDSFATQGLACHIRSRGCGRMGRPRYEDFDLRPGTRDAANVDPGVYPPAIY
jgi:hypothetical protein